MTADWSPLWLSLRVAACGAAIALALGAWLARLLTGRGFRGRNILAAAAQFPLVLPPLILGTYFAFALSGRPEGFTWPIAAAAGAASALPALARAARAALESLDPNYENAARSLGAPPWRVFWLVAAPLAWRPALAAAALAFVRLAAEYALTIFVAAPAESRSALLAGPLAPVIAIVGVAALYAAHRLERRPA